MSETKLKAHTAVSALAQRLSRITETSPFSIVTMTDCRRCTDVVAAAAASNEMIINEGGGEAGAGGRKRRRRRRNVTM